MQTRELSLNSENSFHLRNYNAMRDVEIDEKCERAVEAVEKLGFVRLRDIFPGKIPKGLLPRELGLVSININRVSATHTKFRRSDLFTDELKSGIYVFKKFNKRVAGIVANFIKMPVTYAKWFAIKPILSAAGFKDEEISEIYSELKLRTVIRK